MKITSVLIKKFKSIKELRIPLQSYGVGTHKSNTAFLVGINESGKSAILEALSLINVGLSDIDYEEYCFLKSQDDENDDGYIDIYVDLETEIKKQWVDKLVSEIGISKEFASKIILEKVIKNVYADSESAASSYSVKVNNNLPLYEYALQTTEEVVNNKTVTKTTIVNISQENSIEGKITEKNATSFLLENQKLLTKDKLEGKIATCLNDTFNIYMPEIQIWKYSPEYLIDETISLAAFKEDTSISLPLQNMFKIYGKRSDDEIKATIDRALTKQERCDELIETMSTKITKHINKIWKEHKIKVKMSINGDSCNVFVEDKDQTQKTYFKMLQRSEGFKQFVSLILSLSALNESDGLENNIILIDEPEVHLHPSGVQYMRDEILKIGKKNHVIVATHSHYMVDTSTPERHWIVQKAKSETSISQVNGNTPIQDDKVLASAFGLNLFKELLPKNIIVVEGGDDKCILENALKLLNEKFFYSIKSAGGASKVPGFARLLNDEDVPAFILFDSDKDGRDNKKIILKEQSECYSDENVFTLNDLDNSLPKDSTIEDILPLDFVKEFFEKEMNQSFILEENKSIIHQIKNQCSKLKSDKQKLDSLKIKLSEAFCNKFKTKSNIQPITRLCKVITELVNKIEAEKKL